MSASVKPITRSCGSAVSAWTSALPAWPEGSKPNLALSWASSARSRGTCAGGVASEALVHTPAWIDSATTLPFSRTGTMNRSSGTRRCTFDSRLALTISGACARLAALVEPGEGALVRWVGEDRLGALAADAEHVRCALPSRWRVTWPSWVSMPPSSQRSSAAPSVSTAAMRSASAQHRLAQPGPVVHRRAHVGQRRREVLLERAALLGVEPRGLDVDHRFARRPRRRRRETPRSAPLALRRTATTGCTSRSIDRPCADTVAATELTRNGMSSLISAMRMNRRPSAAEERTTTGSPGSRRAAASSVNRAASASASFSNAHVARQQRFAHCLAERLASLPPPRRTGVSRSVSAALAAIRHAPSARSRRASRCYFVAAYRSNLAPIGAWLVTRNPRKSAGPVAFYARARESIRRAPRRSARASVRARRDRRSRPRR